jgi:hypothetical protein
MRHKKAVLYAHAAKFRRKDFLPVELKSGLSFYKDDRGDIFHT